MPHFLAAGRVHAVQTVVAGANVTYTLTVVDNGPSDAANLSVTDTLPAGLTIAGTSGNKTITILDTRLLSGSLTVSLTGNGTETSTFTDVRVGAASISHRGAGDSSVTINVSGNAKALNHWGSLSIKSGIGAVSDKSDGAVICLGDMPLIDAELIDRLIAAFAPDRGNLIVVPVAEGRRGNPVLWSRRFFGELMTLDGDIGARHLIGKHGETVAEVPVEGESAFLDIDTPQALETARRV